MKFAANISWLFKEEANLLKRFVLAKQAGFMAVELAWPYEYNVDEFRAAVSASSMELVLLNTPPGGKGDLGLAAVPNRSDEFLSGLQLAIDYAKAGGCSMIHIMAGLLPEGDVSVETRANYRQQFISNLQAASDLLKNENMTGLIEPINTRVSVPRYCYSTPEEAFDILSAVNRDNIKYQCDLFHLQIEHGNVARFLQNNVDKIGHIQVAQVPDRHEPDSEGEMNYDFVFGILRKAGYDRWIGLEYAPAGETTDGLKWMDRVK